MAPRATPAPRPGTSRPRSSPEPEVTAGRGAPAVTSARFRTSRELNGPKTAVTVTRWIDLCHGTRNDETRIHCHCFAHGLVIVVVCLGLAVVVAAMASLNVALPDVAQDIHATQTDLVWVIDAYSLAFAALLLPAGGIGDRYGRRVA